MKSDAKDERRELAERMLARFGAMAALILIGAVVFYGR